MTKSRILIYGLIFNCIILLSPYKCFSKNINKTFYKIGYTEKMIFDFSVIYNHYNQNNNYQINIFDISNQYIPYKTNSEISSIYKSKDGIKLELGVRVLPPLRFFINYNYGTSLTNIKYKLYKNDIVQLLRDYSGEHTIRDEEHTFLAGMELSYEYKINNYIPYITLSGAYGITSSSNYDTIYYSANFTLKTGFYYVFNSNIKLNTYLGADYFSYYQGDEVRENFIITLPEDVLIQNTVIDSFDTFLQYEEIYDNNISMLLGLELELYKYTSLFLEAKFINNFQMLLGLKLHF